MVKNCAIIGRNIHWSVGEPKNRVEKKFLFQTFTTFSVDEEEHQKKNKVLKEWPRRLHRRVLCSRIVTL